MNLPLKTAAAVITSLFVLAKAGAASVSIQNGHLRATLTTSPSSNQWALQVDARSESAWTSFARLGILGNVTGKEKTAKYRKRLGTYYPLIGAMPTAVKTDNAGEHKNLSFRLLREELWLDVKLTLLADQPFLLLESPASSHPELVPESSLQFLQPVFYLLTDASDNVLQRREWHAKDYRDQGMWTNSRHYLVPWSAEMDVMPMVLSVPETNAKRAQWPRGGFNNVWLQMPYAIAADADEYTRDTHTIQHRAVGFMSRLQRLMR